MKSGDVAAWNRTLLADVPVLVLSLLFLCVAAYHALLYLRRRKEKGHLWFSVLSLCFAVNTFASSYWIYQLTDRYDLAVRASDLNPSAAMSTNSDPVRIDTSVKLRRPPVAHCTA